MLYCWTAHGMPWRTPCWMPGRITCQIPCVIPHLFKPIWSSDMSYLTWPNLTKLLLYFWSLWAVRPTHRSFDDCTRQTSKWTVNRSYLWDPYIIMNNENTFLRIYIRDIFHATDTKKMQCAFPHIIIPFYYMPLFTLIDLVTCKQEFLCSD